MCEQNSLKGSLIKIKQDYIKKVQSINVEQFKKEAQKEKETVTLYHGTTTARLNSILRHGILPRKETRLDNFYYVGSSIENLIYMTNKWHYFYAVNAEMVEIDSTYGDKRENYFIQRSSYPCYIECKVPKSLLIMDEDFILSNFMRKKIQSCLKKEKDLIFNPMECLAEYGTVGVLGGVSPSMIVSFTVLGEPNMFQYIALPQSPYYKEWSKWQQGKGKGKIKLKQLWEKEAESNLNGTWWIHEVKENSNVSFAINPSSGKLAMFQ